MKTTAQSPRSVTLNEAQKLYVIPCGGGCSCYGFDNAFDEAAQLAALLSQAAPDRAQWGTMGLWERLGTLRAAYAARPDLNERTFFQANTPEAVKTVLEHSRKTGAKLRIFLGNTDTGRAWLDEFETVGRVGRSMGPQQVPLLIVGNSGGGGAISTSSIVRISCAHTLRPLYSHPSFNVTPLEVRAGTVAGYPSEVWDTEKNDCVARFKTAKKAAQWVAFMRGESAKA